MGIIEGEIAIPGGPALRTERPDGTPYAFERESCGFEAEIYGGFDVGLISATQPIASQECGVLADTILAWHRKPIARE